MRARLASLIEWGRGHLDRSLLHTAIKAVVWVALLSVAAQHLSYRRAFDKTGLERLAEKASTARR